ncbi:MAG: cation:proton antiporter [Gaiellaceae bacterium]
MDDVIPFAVIVAAAALAVLAAAASARISERIRVPTPAIFLVAASVLVDAFPRLGGLSVETNQRIVTVALILILFDGGMHIGVRRFRPVAGPVLWVGIAGTFATAGALALATHTLFGFDWRAALLLSTALAPTDPAVVFSVLGRREIAGRTGTLLEGESGANDPVGIALMVALLGAHGAGPSAIGAVTVAFLQQMVIGAAVGIAGGTLLLWFMRRVPLPSEGLYALRVLFGALTIYGLATAAQGSGFLAVFAAGILLGDERAPYKREIERFHSSLASLGEIIAFTMLGLTISLRDLQYGGSWWLGLLLAVALAFVIRPLFAGLVLMPVRLRRNERIFVLWTGLKGAVPILLGTFILQAGVPGAPRAYEIIFVVVAFSVIVQGGLVPALTRRLRIPLRVVEPEPWSLGVRFQEEPEGLHRYQVRAGSAADGATVDTLPCGEDVWVSFVIRDGRLVPVRGDTEMRAGDEVLILADDAPHLEAVFTERADNSSTG